MEAYDVVVFIILVLGITWLQFRASRIARDKTLRETSHIVLAHAKRHQNDYGAYLALLDVLLEIQETRSK